MLTPLTSDTGVPHAIVAGSSAQLCPARTVRPAGAAPVARSHPQAPDASTAVAHPSPSLTSTTTVAPGVPDPLTQGARGSIVSLDGSSASASRDGDEITPIVTLPKTPPSAESSSVPTRSGRAGRSSHAQVPSGAANTAHSSSSPPGHVRLASITSPGSAVPVSVSGTDPSDPRTSTVPSIGPALVGGAAAAAGTAPTPIAATTPAQSSSAASSGAPSDGAAAPPDHPGRSGDDLSLPRMAECYARTALL
ncbi:hypothetical protein B5808_14090 [Cnuibacter physcomitrellae]|uniref:Uncharacterized protein n=1 Tax=Cnuibacter physcomitrellae TaxID=1619308 RepID=A0A1X9LM10_9MICO|nr:hypothetical protein B5808_14090 [Cnuibacter physcomitrellae]